MKTIAARTIRFFPPCRLESGILICARGSSPIGRSPRPRSLTTENRHKIVGRTHSYFYPSISSHFMWGRLLTCGRLSIGLSGSAYNAPSNASGCLRLAAMRSTRSSLTVSRPATSKSQGSSSGPSPNTGNPEINSEHPMPLHKARRKRNRWSHRPTPNNPNPPSYQPER
jgi:hypothetical protein